MLRIHVGETQQQEMEREKAGEEAWSREQAPGPRQAQCLPRGGVGVGGARPLELQPEEARQGHLVHPYLSQAQGTWDAHGDTQDSQGVR